VNTDTDPGWIWLLGRSAGAEAEGEVGHAGDDCLGLGLGHVLAFAGLIRVADAGYSGAVGCLDVGEGVADEGCGGRVGVQAADGSPAKIEQIGPSKSSSR
jgi:hypothetical protein